MRKLIGVAVLALPLVACLPQQPPQQVAKGVEDMRLCTEMAFRYYERECQGIECPDPYIELADNGLGKNMCQLHFGDGRGHRVVRLFDLPKS